MRDGTTRTPLNLELQAPLLRPEAFPWGSANVEIRAICTAQKAYRRVISLPGVMDLSATALSPGEEEDSNSQPEDSLGIEIMGYDNGVTFTLGKASIPLPPKLQPTTMSESQFRVCLTGEEGVRRGTLVGKFQACGPTSDHPEAGEAVVTNASQSHHGFAVGGVREESAGEAAQQAGKVNLLEEH